MIQHRHSLLILATLTAMLAGCGSSPTTRLYALKPPSLAGLGEGSDPVAKLQIAVGPISVPERTERPQIVTMNGDRSVHASETNRWAEPIKPALLRQISAGVAVALRSHRVRPYDQDMGVDPDLRVAVDILRLDITPGGEAVVEAQWTLRRKGKPSRGGHAEVREAVKETDYPALVLGLERALAKLSRDIAATIRAAE